MTEKTKANPWIPTCNRFVAFMDIMGFRDMVYRNSHNEVMRMMQQFKETIKLIDKGDQSSIQREGTKVKPVIFSDSVILFSNDGSARSLKEILWAVQYLIGDAMIHGIPMKGAISFGKQTADLDESLYFGRPLIDAWELQGELYMYGVVLHHTVEKYVHQHKEKLDFILNRDIRKYDAPFKQGVYTTLTPTSKQIAWSFLKKSAG